MCGIAFALRCWSVVVIVQGFDITCLPISFMISHSPESATSDAQELGSNSALAPSPLTSKLSDIEVDQHSTVALDAKHDSLDEHLTAANERWKAITDAVRPRGPDASYDLIDWSPVGEGIDLELRFHGSVLHMRGDEVTRQPFVASSSGDVFLWNGEIFDGMKIDSHSNDGLEFFQTAQRAGPEDFLSLLRPIEGPYAFIYFQKSARRIWYARDHLGRRSLLVHRPTSKMPFWTLTSSAPSVSDPTFGEWEEVPCHSVYCIDLTQANGLHAKKSTPDQGSIIQSYPRVEKSSDTLEKALIYPYDRLFTTNPTAQQLPTVTPLSFPLLYPELDAALSQLEQALEQSIKQRILNVATSPAPPKAPIAVLFSGGLDCTTLTYLVDRVLDPEEPIDLINVSFENPRALLSRKTEVGKKKKGKRKEDETNVEELMEATHLDDTSMYDVPDRITGRDSWDELRRLRPNRRWNFVEVNVPYQEMLEHRSTVIDLMRPQRTVMDLSISLAFYFAARGRGHLAKPPENCNSSPPTPYHSQARVLLSGLGADELLGGYARHRKAFYTYQGGHIDSTSEITEGSWSHLIAEMQMDLDRLPIRNLGRDDRIISHHGKEARYPFLAAHVIELCTKLPIWIKCDPRFGEGTGDKMLLRMLADRLGLKVAARLKKRAVHFGARTAKMELGSGKDKGENELEY